MKHILEMIENHSRMRGDDLCISGPDGTLNWRDFWTLSGGYWHALTQAGLMPGDVFGCRLDDGSQRLACLVGALRAGITFTLIDARLPDAVAQEIAVMANVKAMVGDVAGVCGAPDLGPILPNSTLPLMADQDDQAIAFVAFSSGTTGRPKGIPHRRSSLRTFTFLAAKQIQDHCDRAARFGAFWPPQMLGQLMVGKSCEIYDLATLGGNGILSWARERRITLISGYPAMFRAIAEDALPTPDLKAIFLIGEALKQSDLEKFDRITSPGAVLLSSYGTMEFPFIASIRYRTGDPSPGAVVPMGKPLPEVTVRILDPDGAPLPDYATGEMVIEAPEAPLEYLNDPERSARTFKPSPVTGVWSFFTGDLAYRDSAGILHTAGRIDDQVKIRGYNVRTSYVEQAIQAHASVDALVVVGLDGPKNIRRLVCFYEADTPIDIRAIQIALGRELPAYMIPGRFLQVDRLPRTSTGKILRRDLPDPFSSAVAPTVDFAGTEGAIATVWADILGHGDFTADDDFFDIGGDSLQAMEMLLACEKVTGVRTPLETLILEGASIAAIAARIETARQRKPDQLQKLNLCQGKKRLVALHTVGGDLSDYLELSAAMDPFLSLVGIHPRGLNGRDIADSTLESLADHASEMILKDGSADDIHLIGFSAAGFFAWETARALQAKGASPKSLVMIDTRCRYDADPGVIRKTVRSLRKGAVAKAASLVWDEVIGAFQVGDEQGGLRHAHFAALRDTDLKPLDLDHILLVRASHGALSDQHMDQWQRLVGDDLTVAELPGDHMSVLRGDGASSLARRIADWLP